MSDEPPPPATPETPKEPPTQASEVPSPAAPETTKEPPTPASEVPSPAAPETTKEPPTPASEVPSPAAPETTMEPPTQASEVPSPAAPETTMEPPTQASEVPPPAPTRLQPRSAPISSFKDVRPVLREMLDQLHHPIIDTVERQTGMDREQLFFAVVALLTFYLLFGSYNIFVSNVLVKCYPVYQSVMTIRSQSKTDDTQWLAYWCAFALFSLVDHFIAPFGLYLLLKTAVLVYMLLPQTYGAHNCFVNYVQPMMERFAERRVRRHAH